MAYLTKVSFSWLHYFPATKLHQHGDSILSCKFVRNISTNIQSLGSRTDLELEEVFSLFVVYKIISS